MYTAEFVIRFVDGTFMRKLTETPLGYRALGGPTTPDIEDAYRIRDRHIAEWMVSRSTNPEWRGAQVYNPVTGLVVKPKQVPVPVFHQERTRRTERERGLKVRPAASPRESRSKEPRVYLIFVTGDSYRVSHRADLPMYEDLSSTIKTAIETRPSMMEDLKYLIVINGESHSRFSAQEVKAIASR